MDKQRLIELHSEGKTDSEIAKIMGVSSKLVFFHRKNLGLPSNFSYKSFRKMDYEKVKEMVEKNMTDREIAEIVGVKKVSIYFFRKRNSIERSNLAEGKPIEPTKRQMSILVGTLLGDASLRNDYKNPSFSCEHGIKQKKYCKWKADELSSLNSRLYTYTRKTVDKRTGIFYESAVCVLPANPKLLDMYNSLYINGRKTITKEFLNNFDELSLAVMFMDDGAKTTSSITIATNCFSEDELIILINFLKKRFNLTFHICSQHQIYLISKDFERFKEIVLPYMHEDLLYKLSLNHVNLGKSGDR